MLDRGCDSRNRAEAGEARFGLCLMITSASHLCSESRV